MRNTFSFLFSVLLLFAAVFLDVPMTRGQSLAAAVASTPSGGTLVLSPGTYTVTSNISRTTPITITCQGGAIIQSDINFLSLTGGAGGSAISGCDFEPVSTFHVCTVSQITSGACSSYPVIALTRFPGDVIGYEPTSNDGDIWPYLTATQKSNNGLGPHINAFVPNFTFSGNTGKRLYVQVAGASFQAYNNNFVGGPSTFGCLEDSDNSGQQDITGVKIHDNTIIDCQYAGIAVGNTYAADIYNNHIDYNGGPAILTIQSFAQFGNVYFNIHDNEGSYNYQGGLDAQADFPATGTEPTHGIIHHNNFSNNGTTATNAQGIATLGDYIQVTDNVLEHNACGGFSHYGGNYLVFTGNIIFSNYPSGPSGCGINNDVNINAIANSSGNSYGQSPIIAHNQISAAGNYAIDIEPSITNPVLVGNIATGKTIRVLTPTLTESGDFDSNGPMGTFQKNYLMPGEFSNQGWYHLGTIDLNSDLNVTIFFASGHGANVGSNQHGFGIFEARSAGGAGTPNISGATLWNFGSNANTAMQLVATGASTSASNTKWEVWIQAQSGSSCCSFASGDFRVMTGGNSTWTPDPSLTYSSSTPGVTPNTYVNVGIQNFIDASGTIYPAKLNQSQGNAFAGTCSMSGSSSCSFSINFPYANNPIGIASPQGAIYTGGAASCSVSGTTATINVPTANSLVWGCVLVGNPN
ncbi:hypothetical protein FTW19_04655 [Terriglobus albidus]|uniref:Right handed beta helix domain-containing protein n=1 Tax=Terriglobus albidus TaxID=1592106 RepID=A0A5B9E4Z0_9BACT|nr:right-handed parallel beta-helix repeat-containing protein [Terriglobus albidus]QEE27363.1 hypothetical protein FTW19_04655 [Terriglobus albidus]